MRHNNVALVAMLALAIGGCATAGQKITKDDEEGPGAAPAATAAARNETAPKPPSDSAIQAQKKAQPAGPSAPKLSASAKAEFDSAVKKWSTAQGQKGGLGPGDCKSLAGNFQSIRDPMLTAQAHFNAGTILESCGHDKDAEGEYQAALQANSAYAPALSNLGELYYKQGNPTTARMWFEKAIAADPTHASSAYTNMAAIQFTQARNSGDQGLYREAITNARRALAIDNDSMAAYGILALIYYTIAENDQSKLDLAKLVCTEGLRSDKTYAPIYNTLGLIQLRRKHISDALREFESAVSYDPKYIEAHLNIGAIGLSTRQYEKAAASFAAVLKLDPKNLDATIGMGVASRGIGTATKDPKKIEEAESWYKKVAELDHSNCSIQYNLGVLYQDYKLSADNSNLNTAKDFFTKYRSCTGTMPDKVKDAERRMKDIDDTFVALEQAKKMEAEAKAMQEEAERQQKQMEEQQKAQDKAAQDKAGAAAPAAGDKAAGDKAAAPAEGAEKTPPGTEKPAK
jgi:tetratricopeptide (TPR) repeat protein